MIGLTAIPSEMIQSVIETEIKGCMENTTCCEGVGEAPVKSGTIDIWRKGGKYAGKEGRVGIIILLHFQKAFEKLFAKLIKVCKETKLPQDWLRSWVLG